MNIACIRLDPVPQSAVISDRIHTCLCLPSLVSHSILDQVKAGWNYTKGAKEKKNKINGWPCDLLSDSVQDFFDAPAAEQEIQALLHRLDEAVGKVATQQVLSSSQTHNHVPKMLSQGGGGHGLGKRTLRVHCCAGKVRSDLACAAAEVCSDSRCPEASCYL